MLKKRPIIAYIFTVLIALIAAFVTYYCSGHLKIYSGNTRDLIHAIKSRDFFTLFIGVPLLLLMGFMALRRSNRAYLVWLGTLAYFMTTYLWYAAGTAYNQFFLIYVVLFTLSFFAFIRALFALDAEAFCLRFSPKTPLRFAALIMFGGGLLLAYLWLNPLLPALKAGTQPDLLHCYGSTSLIHLVLNLGVVSPLAIITSLWIWKGKPWGYIIVSILLFYGLTVNLVFLVSQWFSYNLGNPADIQRIIISVAITVVFLILYIVFLKNLREEIIQDHRNRITSLV
jgi:hypothetical protein